MTHICVVCGSGFTSERFKSGVRTLKYCSAYCRDRRKRTHSPEYMERQRVRARERYSTEAYQAARARVGDEKWRERDRERKRRLRQRPGWKARTPEQQAVQWARRQARKRGAPGHFTVEDWVTIIDRYEHRCLACRRHESERPLTIDHIIPLSDTARTSNWPDNLQPLCKPCNSAKGAREIDYRPLVEAA